MLNQVHLIVHITEMLSEKHGIQTINQEQFNAVIKAADMLCEAFRKKEKVNA